MQVRTYSGGIEAFKALTYSQPQQHMLDYYRNNIASMAQPLTAVGNYVVNATKDLYDRLHNSELVRSAKLLLQSAGGHLSESAIYYVPYEALNQANLRMQQYIMAYPELQLGYQRNMYEGYPATYFNNYGDIKPKENPYYLDVTSGVAIETSDRVTVRHHKHSYDTERLDVYDKFAILRTWNNVMLALESDIDPTNPDEYIE